MAQTFFRSGLGRLVLALMLVAIAPAMLLLAHLGDEARRGAERRAALHQQQAAAAAVRLFEEMLDSVGRTLAVSAAEAADWGAGPACAARAAKLAAAQPFILRLVVVAADGRVLCTSAGVPAAPVNLGDRPVVGRAPRSDGPVIGAPLVSRLTGEVVLPIAVAIPQAPGDPRPDRPAVLSASLDLPWLARLVRALDANEELDPFALILGENGRVLAAAPAIPGLPAPDRPSDHPLVAAALAGPLGWVRVADFAGRDRLVGVAHTLSSGLAIAVAVDRDAVVRPIEREFLVILGLMLAAAAAGLGGALAVARARLGRPLLALVGAAEAVRDGRPPPPLAELPTVGEIATLRRAFAQMVGEIARREARLAEANRELAAMNEELARLAERDPLTGLANRRAFDAALAAAWNRGRREGLPVGLLILDIDHFKQFNDRYGHLEGDACLARVAATLAGLKLRPYDLVARLGGEEFAVLLPDIDLVGAIAVGERIRAALHELMLLHEGSPHGIVTASIGAASLVPVGPADPRMLLAAADRALYAAKRGGRDQVSAAGYAAAA
ncbi:diguanylate cyclase domain-containing protein [Elioraea sp.]|uniref:sensor domain-containing diguanylate cyclase n=1 Tax=Elioraea sp. TaxID=2185103 RepID=UPI0021DD3089|nr:diguanylate cyclase [Elioraea sp.]GIX10138.1 MAG: GGDEF domain-containing protein [Elioraea sp.]